MGVTLPATLQPEADFPYRVYKASMGWVMASTSVFCQTAPPETSVSLVASP